MTAGLRCLDCKRLLKHPSPTGYGPECARKRGLGPKRNRSRAIPRLKPATVPAAPDELPGQEALPLFYFAPTLESL
ncbi:hypothetical protein [Streptomyces sp. NBC_00847]|uniref:hypothetical protein n=1 Tax=Streptomyces sp. NBC_00847 TaxID=2975850 RepID=UPI00225DDD32|nr:hypothetical protein [Streptomyces sp. NBC_00847]MCX4885913.1 hypothetical protein [Streptomyces sp. NBC_00847]